LGHGASIVRDGLVLCLDAANPKSYPGSGTVWSDLSGNSNNGTLINGPTYDSGNSGSLVFDGVNDYGRITSTPLNAGTFAYTNITVNLWFKPLSSYSGTNQINNLITVEESFEISVGDIGNGYSSLQYASNPWGWYGTSTNTLVNNQWNMVTFVHATTGRWLYTNGVQVFYRGDAGNVAAGNATYPYLTLMARASGNSSLAEGNLSSVQLYNRALSSTEIQQNFNATRSRYGI